MKQLIIALALGLVLGMLLNAGPLEATHELGIIPGGTFNDFIEQHNHQREQLEQDRINDDVQRQLQNLRKSPC